MPILSPVRHLFKAHLWGALANGFRQKKVTVFLNASLAAESPRSETSVTLCVRRMIVIATSVKTKTLLRACDRADLDTDGCALFQQVLRHEISQTVSPVGFWMEHCSLISNADQIKQRNIFSKLLKRVLTRSPKSMTQQQTTAQISGDATHGFFLANTS